MVSRDTDAVKGTRRLTRDVTGHILCPVTSMASPKYSGIGARIRAARHVTGMSQETFADRVGTSRRHVMRLERGDHRPSAPMLARIATATGVSESSLLNGEDDEESHPAMRHAFDLFVDLMDTLAFARNLA